jgi:hypothetical protein
VPVFSIQMIPVENAKSPKGLRGAFLSVLFVLICMASPQRATADLLSPADETLQVMLGNQEENLIVLAASFGPLAASLTFSVQIDPAAMTYTDSLAPGSTYGGLPLQLTMEGAFDVVSDQWTSTTTGAIGSTSLVGAGSYVFTDPPGGAEEASNYNLPPPPAPPTVHVKDTRTFVTDPTDDSMLLSFDTFLVTDLTTGKTSTTEGSDSRKKTLDELIDEYNLAGAFNPDNPNLPFPALEGQGSVDLDSGVGTFFVSPVPEPSSWLLLATTLAGLLPLCWRRLRA